MKLQWLPGNLTMEKTPTCSLNTSMLLLHNPRKKNLSFLEFFGTDQTNEIRVNQQTLEVLVDRLFYHWTEPC